MTPFTLPYFCFFPQHPSLITAYHLLLHYTDYLLAPQGCKLCGDTDLCFVLCRILSTDDSICSREVQHVTHGGLKNRSHNEWLGNLEDMFCDDETVSVAQKQTGKYELYVLAFFTLYPAWSTFTDHPHIYRSLRNGNWSLDYKRNWEQDFSSWANNNPDDNTQSIHQQ